MKISFQEFLNFISMIIELLSEDFSSWAPFISIWLPFLSFHLSNLILNLQRYDMQQSIFYETSFFYKCFFHLKIILEQNDLTKRISSKTNFKNQNLFVKRFGKKKKINNNQNRQMNKDDKKKDVKKEKVSQNDKYYKIKADFSYLKQYNYKITKEIGRGGYGVVYKATDLTNPDNVCAIKINFNTVSRELIYAEMAFLLLVKNKRNLPKLVNLFVYHDITHIVIEYFKFRPFITFFNTFSIEDIKHYIYELLIGLKNLKDLGIYHRDIKPGNFLYNPETKKGMIIDFGLAEIDPKYQTSLEEKVKKMKQENHPEYRQKQEQLKIYKRLSDCLKIIGRNKIGTETYMPLESILHHSQQSYQSDMWPVGVILFQFIARKYNIFNNVRMVNKPNNVKNYYYIHYIIELATFFGDEVVEQCRNLGYELKLPKDIEKINFRDIKNIDGYDDDTDDLLYRLLALNPDKRITVEEAMAHKFFDAVRKEHQ